MASQNSDGKRRLSLNMKKRGQILKDLLTKAVDNTIRKPAENLTMRTPPKASTMRTPPRRYRMTTQNVSRNFFFYILHDMYEIFCLFFTLNSFILLPPYILLV